MATPFGGETPLAGQDGRITAEAPSGATVAAPVIQGGIYRLIGGTAADSSAYKMVAVSDEDTIVSTLLCVALHTATAPTDPVGVLVLNGYMGAVVRLKYANLPTLGQSIKVAATTTQVDGDTWARGGGTIMKIDTVNTEVEVLFA